MGWWRWVRRRWQVLFDKDSAEVELDDEIRFHLEMEIRQHIESGVDATEARRRALVAFGGVERFKEGVRDVRGARILDDFVRDSRVALRSLPKQPAFLLAVLMTLGIGIGGNVAMFGVMERSLFRALPYPDADDLVLGRVTWEGEVGFTVSGPDFFDYQDEAASLENLAALTPFTVMATVTGGGEPERVSAPLASVGFFETFEVNPAVGRFFAPDEGQPGGAAVVVLSHGYWQRRYAGDPGIVGAAISVEGLPTTVVGVAPAGFRFLMDADMWRPIQRGAGWASARQFHNFVLVGRLADGTSVEAAQAEIDAISTRLEDVYPDTNRDKGLNVTPLRQALAERYGPTLNILSVAVAVLLLIACANVSGLLLARGGARRSEMAVRSVMGGGRGRLARQLLTENVYLALGAGVVGTAMAVWIQRGILTFMSMEMLGRIEPGISGKTLVFALSMSALTVLLFGVIPSLSMTRTDPAGDLRAGAGRGGERRSLPGTHSRGVGVRHRAAPHRRGLHPARQVRRRRGGRPILRTAHRASSRHPRGLLRGGHHAPPHPGSGRQHPRVPTRGVRCRRRVRHTGLPAQCDARILRRPGDPLGRWTRRPADRQCRRAGSRHSQRGPGSAAVRERGPHGSYGRRGPGRLRTRDPGGHRRRGRRGIG